MSSASTSGGFDGWHWSSAVLALAAAEMVASAAAGLIVVFGMGLDGVDSRGNGDCPCQGTASQRWRTPRI